MSCLIWNCRGLGNPCTGNELADIVRAKDPSVVFIAETWADEARLKDVNKRFNSRTCLCYQEKRGVEV